MAGSDALIFFYGVFWATSVASAARYKPFSTHLFWHPGRRAKALKRFGWSFLFINLCPIISVALLHSFVVPDESGFWAILSAGVASLSVFGFIRILHSVIASSSTYARYYTEQEWARMTADWLRDDPNDAVVHVVPGIFYVGVVPVLAWILGRIGG